MSVDLHACFKDFQKAFGNVKHNILIETLRDIRLDGRYIRVIVNLYWNQTAVVKILSRHKKLSLKNGVDTTSINEVLDKVVGLVINSF